MVHQIDTIIANVSGAADAATDVRKDTPKVCLDRH